MDEKLFNRLLKSLRDKEVCFRLFYEFYYPKIVFYVTENYHDENLAQDAAQEFFQMLLTKANLPKYVKFPTLWVMRNCDGIARELLSQNTDGESVSLEKANGSSVAMRQLDPALADTWALLENLDETSERIVVMRVCEGYDFKEIADLLGLSYDAVRQRYSRGIRLMRDKSFESDRDDDDSVQ